MIITKYDYNVTVISAICQVGEYLWIAFTGSGGNSILKKVSAFNPYQVFFTITVSVDNINKIKSYGDYIYLAIDDSNYIGVYFNSNSPLTTYGYLDRPIGITEESIDVSISSTNIFFLTAGVLSGTNSKVVRFSSSTYVFGEIIDLSTITNANTMDIDGSNNLWIATNELSPKLVKVYNSGGYTYTSWNINDLV